MNQTVLLRGVNDDAEALDRALPWARVGARVRPYYLLQMDPVKGTSHLRTHARGARIELVGALQGASRASRCPSSFATRPTAAARSRCFRRASSRGAMA
jgi:lysine 2,3-aminomutase